MSISLQERNAQYFEHLLRVGVIDNEQYEAICEICGDKEEKQILFAISNFFANFTASDWFDLSCRMFNHWQRGPQPDLNKPLSNRQPDYLDSSKSNREYELPQRDYTVYGARTHEKTQEKRSAPPSEPKNTPYNSVQGQEKPQKQQKQEVNYEQESREAFERVVENKIALVVDIFTSSAQRAAFSELKNDFQEQRQMEQIDNRNRGQTRGFENETLQKLVTPSKQDAQRVSRKSGEKDANSRLYYDHFQKQAQLDLRREMKKQSELENCTFKPQIKQFVSDNDALQNNLRVPVFDRLNQPKAVPNSMILEKQEYRELRGATFQPDISKSQKKNRWQDEGSPDERKQDAVERLYNEAQIKEKMKFLKQMQKQEQELEGCTFNPNVTTPTKDKTKFIKNDLSKSVDRLYDENMRRHRNMLRKEVEVREKELEGCTFQPERPSRNFKSRGVDEFEELEVHDRLYKRFEKKRDTANNSMQQDVNGRGTSQSRGTMRGRSNSASQERSINSGLRSPIQRDSSNVSNINTPAFDRLYRDMALRKQKMNQIREKVNKEEGVTFKPKTNWSKKNKRSTSVLDQSNPDLRQGSKYNSRYIEEESYRKSRGEPEDLGNVDVNNFKYQPNQRRK